MLGGIVWPEKRLVEARRFRSSPSAYVVSQRAPKDVALELVAEALPLSRSWRW